LAAKCKEDKLARWIVLKSLEDEKWRTKSPSKERKTKVEEHRLALEENFFAKEKKDEECAILRCNYINFHTILRACMMALIHRHRHHNLYGAPRHNKMTT
jgi:hypothetical protein